MHLEMKNEKSVSHRQTEMRVLITDKHFTTGEYELTKIGQWVLGTSTKSLQKHNSSWAAQLIEITIWTI